MTWDKTLAGMSLLLIDLSGDQVALVLLVAEKTVRFGVNRRSQVGRWTGQQAAQNLSYLLKPYLSQRKFVTPFSEAILFPFCLGCTKEP